MISLPRKSCNKMLVGEPIYTSAQGIPMTPLKAEGLTYLIQRAVNSGHWTSYKRRHLPSSTCEQVTEIPEGQVSASDFLGQAVLAWILLFLGALLALTLGRFNRLGKWSAAGYQHDISAVQVVRVKPGQPGGWA